MPQLFLLDNLAISSHVYHSRSKLGRGMSLFVCIVLDVSTMLSHSLFHKTGTAVQASLLSGHVKRKYRENLTVLLYVNLPRISSFAHTILPTIPTYPAILKKSPVFNRSIETMSPTYDNLVDKLAATCVSIHNDTLRPPHDNDGKTNEALILRHDARLALHISTLPFERQRAICQDANLEFDRAEAAPVHPATQPEAHTATKPTLPLIPPPAAKTPQAEAEADEDQDLVFRLQELKPAEVAQAIVDVAGRIRGGLLENNQSARNDGIQEMRGGGG